MLTNEALNEAIDNVLVASAKDILGELSGNTRESHSKAFNLLRCRMGLVTGDNMISSVDVCEALTGVSGCQEECDFVAHDLYGCNLEELSRGDTKCGMVVTKADIKRTMRAVYREYGTCMNLLEVLTNFL